MTKYPIFRPGPVQDCAGTARSIAGRAALHAGRGTQAWVRPAPGPQTVNHRDRSAGGPNFDRKRQFFVKVAARGQSKRQWFTVVGTDYAQAKKYVICKGQRSITQGRQVTVLCDVKRQAFEPGSSALALLPTVAVSGTFRLLNLDS